MRAILTYHSIDESGSPISVAPDVFRAQVRWLASGRVPVVTLERLLAMPGESDAIALTFDDGFRNFGEVAAPLLLEHALPVTLFVVPRHVGGANDWGGVRGATIPTLPLLDWVALGALAERGVSLGAHTRSHPHLTRLAPSALEDELAGGAEAILREAGRRPEEFAYPYGDVNGLVREAARRCYRRAVTTELRAVRTEDDALGLPRLDMFYWRAPGQLEAWGSAAFAGRLWARARARQFRAWISRLGGEW